MIKSTERILTTHAGSLPRPDDLVPMIMARAAGREYDQQALARRLPEAVAEVVRMQLDNGIDSVNDGELSKTNFTNYVRERLAGFITRQVSPERRSFEMNISARDMQDFPEYFATHDFFGRPLQPGAGPFGGGVAGAGTESVCVEPLRYVGHKYVQEDVDNFKAALARHPAPEAFLPANSPGTIEHWLRNEHYASTEEFLLAIAEAMREEYKAIIDAGFVLQIDDPDLPDGWQMFPGMSVEEYRRYAQLRVDALNHALRDLPEDRIRLHVCWGSGHGPHTHDIPLRHIIDIIFSVRAGSYSIEASNPVHEHEWTVFEEVKLPEGKTLVPGVVGHHSNFVEHPELVAQRLIRYANLVGRENVIAGTDCGLGGRVAHPKIAWAKFRSMAEGARIASRKLWGRT
ncbi:MAG TPA: cobalamin-independent methionine synthase II family protein [Dehalococcoidia bacterium]|nr:cobalamin-independent methionine synthase II family protein [Dehalococcoidia bacterium]